MRRTDIIKVPVLESLFPVPRNFDDIKADIEKRGIQMPLTISTNNELVCGHTRYRIAQELGIDDIPVAEPVKFTGLNDMKRYAISDNDLRRQMTDLERYEYVVKPLLEMEREEAKEREKAGVKIEPYPQNAGRVGESVDVVGKQVGWSGDKVQRLKRISENCSIEAKAAFNDGELSQKDALLLAKESTELQNQITENIKSGETQSVTSAKRQVTKETTTVLPLPDGKFDVIYADPPWQYRNSIRQWGPARLHYSTLPLEDICALEIPSAENAVLFLWVTNLFFSYPCTRVPFTPEQDSPLMKMPSTFLCFRALLKSNTWMHSKKPARRLKTLNLRFWVSPPVSILFRKILSHS